MKDLLGTKPTSGLDDDPILAATATVNDSICKYCCVSSWLLVGVVVIVIVIDPALIIYNNSSVHFISSDAMHTVPPLA